MLTPTQVRWLLLGLGLATGMEFFTFDAMNLVLVDLAGTLGVSLDEASWLLTIYSSTLFLGVPVCIWLAGHVGYKRYLMATTLLFAVGSLGCMLSPDLKTMLLWRSVQGFAGAGLVVWWRAAIYFILPRAQRSASMMRVSTMLYLSSATGILLGGVLTDHVTWRLIFLPAIAYTAGALWLIARYFPSVPRSSEPRVIGTDWPGITLLAVSLISLQVVLNRGHIDDWFESPLIRALTWVSLCALSGFLWWQMSARNRVPLLDLQLLRNRFVMASVLIGVFTGMILSGSLYVLPEYLRSVASPRLSATETGEVMCVYALTARAIRPLVTPTIARFGQRRTIIAAMAALIASMWILSVIMTTDTPRFYYALPLVLYALCLAPLLSAVGSGTVARVELNKLLDGVSLYMTFRQFGASLAVALLTQLIESRETLHSERLFEHLQESGTLTASWLARAGSTAITRAGLSPADSTPTAIALLREVGTAQSATLAYADAFLFMAGVGIIALCLVPIAPPSPAPTK